MCSSRQMAFIMTKATSMRAAIIGSISRNSPASIPRRMIPGIALTITSRVPEASSLAKEFRDGKRQERVAVSVDMLSTGYNCRDLLNVVLMRPVFSPTEYIQIKGRGTRLFTFVVKNTEYEKKTFFLLDFCAVAEYFQEQYDYTVPLPLPRGKGEKPLTGGASGEPGGGGRRHPPRARGP